MNLHFTFFAMVYSFLTYRYAVAVRIMFAFLVNAFHFVWAIFSLRKKAWSSWRLKFMSYVRWGFRKAARKIRIQSVNSCNSCRWLKSLDAEDWCVVVLYEVMLWNMWEKPSLFCKYQPHPLPRLLLRCRNRAILLAVEVLWHRNQALYQPGRLRLYRSRYAKQQYVCLLRK